MKRLLRPHLMLFLAIVLGILGGLSDQKILSLLSHAIATLFTHFLSMMAAPIVFFAILSTLLNMKGLDQMKRLGGRVVSYTLLTTFFAALVALGVFLILDPVAAIGKIAKGGVAASEHSYLHFVLDIVPSNIFQAFLDNKVISIAFLGFLFGITAHYLSQEHKGMLQGVSTAVFQLLLKVTNLVVKAMPIVIFGFIVVLIEEMQQQKAQISGLWMYLVTIFGANLIQGGIVIPLLLKAKGLSPWKVAKEAGPAILVAFFTKSSNATLPVSLGVAKEKLKVRPEIADFVLPLCTVINMNGCAAFILTTVLFVSGANGYIFSSLDLGFWVVMSVLAAVGNAGVPMGCFFLSSAFLISMDVPLGMMGLILPFYSLLDMEETALNVWSDLSVTAIVDKLPQKDPITVSIRED